MRFFNSFMTEVLFNPQLHYISPVPKRFTILFVYFHFNIILHPILHFTLFFYHSLYYGSILTDFMAVIGVHWHWPWTLAENRPQGAWRRSSLCDVPVFIFMQYIRNPEVYSVSSQASEVELFCEWSKRLLIVDCFREESFSRMFKFWMRFWSILNYFKLFFRF